MKFKRNGITGDYESDCGKYKIVKYQRKTDYIYIMCTAEDLVYMGTFNYLKAAEEFINNYETNFKECAKYIWDKGD